MAILDLVCWPDKRLTEKSTTVEKVTTEIQKIMDDMLETMYQAQGIGLAAIQVGISKRIIVIDISNGSERYPETSGGSGPLFIANPKIIKSSEKLSTFKEGCLSFPGQFANVKRPEKITLQYLDYNGEKQVIDADGILATCIQHEIDHLNGVVFIDYLSPLKRNFLLKKLNKQQKLYS